MKKSNSKIKFAVLVSSLLTLAASPFCLQQAARACPECVCPSGQCYCTYDYQCVPELNPANQAAQRQREEEARAEEARRREQEAEAARRRQLEAEQRANEEVQRNIQFNVQKQFGQVPDTANKSTPQQPSTTTQSPTPSGFPPALIERMNQLEMAQTVDPQQKEIMRQQLEALKAQYAAAAKVKSPPPTDVIMPGGTSPGMSVEVDSATKRVENWASGADVNKFLSDTDKLLHRQEPIKFFTGPEGQRAANQLENAGTAPSKSEFEIKQQGTEKPGGTPHFGLGGGPGPGATTGSGTQSEFKPRVQMPKQYLRKQTVPPVPPPEEPKQ
jgi:hypothetical protein